MAVDTLLGLIDDTDFATWRAHNERAVTMITHLALSASQRGARRISMKSLFEAVRAQGAFGEATEPFRLNNNRTAEMARYLMDRYPTTLGGKFVTRKRREES